MNATTNLDALLARLGPGPRFHTSDHHFGRHPASRMAEHACRSQDEADQTMIERWNATVPPNGTVIHHGDFAPTATKARQVRPLLNGRIILLPGNVDPIWPHRARQTPRTAAQYDTIFDAVIPTGLATMTLAGRTVLLSHLPYHPDTGHDARYDGQRPADEGLPLLCGHVHQTWANLYGGDGRKHRGQIHVGVDAWDLAPAPHDALTPLLETSR